MGVRNGNAQFQRMMEWVLKDLPYADVYGNDVIIGSTGEKRRFRQLRDEIVSSEEAEHLVEVFSVIAEQFLLRLSHRADDNIIDVNVCKGQVLKDPFHHALELGVPIANAHGHNLPLVEPFSRNRHGG